MPRRVIHTTWCLVPALLATVGVSPVQAQTQMDLEVSPGLTTEIEVAERTMRRFGLAELGAKPEGAVRLTTYNVLNLFDGLDDPHYSGDVDDLDDEKPLHELVAVARAIRAVDADVLCLEEVESGEAVAAFRDRFLADMGYEYLAAIDAGGPRGIEQAVLSRFPLSEPTNWANKSLGGVHPEKYGNGTNWYAGQPIEFRRSPMRVDVKIPSTAGASTTLTLFVVHHKSGFYNHYWREAEAKTMVGLLEPLLADPEARFVVLGDFNADVSNDSVRAYLDAGLADAFAGASESDPEFITHESGRRIDLMLLSPALTERRIKGSGGVLGTAAREEGVDWRDLPTFVGMGSDHYPVSVDLRLGRNEE
ncbi:MAG: endonuclease/exonuclease/phosphatase family metal-dependent hydrolase [Phycisphaerales bacterium]|jgi:endonuclease/exonuclease/phosphatase family metal-dependent hydrolase